MEGQRCKITAVQLLKSQPMFNATEWPYVLYGVHPVICIKPHSIMLLLNALSEFNFKEQLESLSEVRNPPASHLKSFFFTG